MKILLVDDDLNALEYITDVFAPTWGWSVTAVENAELAIHAMGKENFDAVVTDFRLGEGLPDGVAVAQFALAMTPAPVVMLITGESFLPNAPRWVETRCLRVTKPFEPELVRARIEAEVAKRAQVST